MGRSDDGASKERKDRSGSTYVPKVLTNGRLLGTLVISLEEDDNDDDDDDDADDATGR